MKHVSTLVILTGLMSSPAFAASPLSCPALFADKPPGFMERVIAPAVQSRLPLPKIPESLLNEPVFKAPEPIAAPVVDTAKEKQICARLAMNEAGSEIVLRELKETWENQTAKFTEEDKIRILKLAGPDGVFFGKAHSVLGGFATRIAYTLTHTYKSPYLEDSLPGTIGAQKTETAMKTLVSEQALNLANVFKTLALSPLNEDARPNISTEWVGDKYRDFYWASQQFDMKSWTPAEVASFHESARFALLSTPQHRAAFETAAAVTFEAILMNSRNAPGKMSQDRSGTRYQGTELRTDEIAPIITEAYARMGWSVSKRSKALAGVEAGEVPALDRKNLPLYELRSMLFDEVFPKIPLHNEKLQNINPAWRPALAKYLNRVAYRIPRITPARVIEVRDHLKAEHAKIQKLRKFLDQFTEETKPLAIEMAEIEAHIVRRRHAVQNDKTADGNWGFVEQNVLEHMQMLNLGFMTKLKIEGEIDRLDASISNLLTYMNAVRNAHAVGAHSPQIMTLPAPEIESDPFQLSSSPVLSLPPRDPNALY